MSRTGDTSKSLSQRKNEANSWAPIITCLFTAIPSMALQRDMKTIFTAHYPFFHDCKISGYCPRGSNEIESVTRPSAEKKANFHVLR